MKNKVNSLVELLDYALEKGELSAQQGGGKRPVRPVTPRPPITTTAVGEEGDGGYVRPPVTTMAVGEESTYDRPSLTTMMVGEEDGRVSG
jgi:hypothetical protein